MSNIMQYGDTGEFGLAPIVEQAKPALVGGGSALVTAAAARGFAEPGSWIERRAGTIGAVGGTIVALLAKQGGAGIAGAILVGLSVELIELLTEKKMSS